MEKKPNWDLKLPAPGTAFKIFLLSSSSETAARALAGCVCQERWMEESLWRKAAQLVFGGQSGAARAAPANDWLISFAFLIPEGIGQLCQGPGSRVSVQLLLTRYDWPLKHC